MIALGINLTMFWNEEVPENTSMWGIIVLGL